MAPDTKALLCMATLCSTLRYYGHAVIGVVRDHDKELMIKMVKIFYVFEIINFSLLSNYFFN